MEPVAIPPGDIVTAAFCGSAPALGVPDAAAVPVGSGVATSLASTPVISVTLTSVPDTVAARSVDSMDVASGVGVDSTREIDTLDAASVALYMAGTTMEGVKKPAVGLVERIKGAGSSSRRLEGTSE